MTENEINKLIENRKNEKVDDPSEDSVNPNVANNEASVSD